MSSKCQSSCCARGPVRRVAVPSPGASGPAAPGCVCERGCEQESERGRVRDAGAVLSAAGEARATPAPPSSHLVAPLGSLSMAGAGPCVAGLTLLGCSHRAPSLAVAPSLRSAPYGSPGGRRAVCRARVRVPRACQALRLGASYGASASRGENARGSKRSKYRDTRQPTVRRAPGSV